MLRTLAFALFITVSLLVSPSVSFADASGCSIATAHTSGCSVSATNNGTDVTLEGSATKPGGGAGPSGTGSSGGDSSSSGDPTDLAVIRDNYTVTMPVTLADVAKFRPNPGVDLMQPNGWMIVGLSTNFYAHASQHIKTGTLLGGPASVRFTPVRYYWTYGDGGTRTASTPGATWSAHGITEFDATPTSHIYRAPGRYFIDLTIGYAPEYRLADSTEWIPVRGLVWVPANRLVAVASAGAKTVLVEEECTLNPAGPGC